MRIHTYPALNASMICSVSSRMTNCPECGQPVEASFDSKRLYFAKDSVVQWFRAGLVLALGYYAFCLLHMFSSFVFLPSYEIQLVSGSVCNVVGSIALFVLLTSYGLCAGGLIRKAICIFFGFVGIAMAILNLMQRQLVLDYLSSIESFEGIAWDLEFEWILPPPLLYFVWLVGACAFHVVAALLISRVPHRRCSRMLYATGALILITALALVYGEKYSGTHSHVCVLSLADCMLRLFSCRDRLRSSYFAACSLATQFDDPCISSGTH